MMSSLSFFPVFEHKNCTNSRFVFIKIIIELFRWNRERKLKPPSRTTTRAPGITGEEGGNSAKEKLVWRLVWAFPSSVIPRLDNNNKWNYKQRAKDKPCIHCLLGLRRYSVCMEKSEWYFIGTKKFGIWPKFRHTNYFKSFVFCRLF